MPAPGLRALQAGLWPDRRPIPPGDRYANQGTNQLLQRAEDFGGLAILSANLCGSLDDALPRRCAWEIEFPPPGSSRRASLWERIRRRLSSAK